MTSIWDSLVGQDDVVAELQRAVRDADHMTRGEPGPGMTHAWLVTGPPGSGRSTAAVSFATALACPEFGCGVCHTCLTAPLNGHPDVEIVRPEGLSYSVENARELVKSAAMSPTTAHWHVVVVEDADRLTPEAVNVLLKAIEEPPPHTVWVLCAPSVEDVLPTIVSRTRHLPLRTPSAGDVADLLVNAYGIDRAMAAFAARASQGHIGRARALARDEHARLRRQQVLRVPFDLHDIPSCFTCAANIHSAAQEDARAITEPMDAAELTQLQASFGADGESRLKGQLKRSFDSAVKDLDKRQKTRRKRVERDQIDRALVDLLGLYRDVLAVQWESDQHLINEEMRPQLSQLAAASTANDTGRRVHAIGLTRKQIEKNVTPLVALEALMVELKDPWIRMATG